jgi:DNA-binding NarL/FixJ family response regulator
MLNPIAIEHIAPRISLLRPKLRTIAQLLAEGRCRADIAQHLGVTRGTLTNLEAELRAVLDIPKTLPLERRRELVVEAWR